MDDDQFQGGLSGQGGNPAPANNSNTYDFTNGDPLASLDNPEAAAQAAAEADPADNIAVDPLANEPIMDLTNNVNISAPEITEEPEVAAPAEEPEGPISEMSRRMDEELGNIDGAPSQADVPTEEPAPSMDTAAPAGEPAVEAMPQVLAPEPAPEIPSQSTESSAMSFETTDIPGQTPAPVADDIPSFEGESRPSIATVGNAGKKSNKSLMIVLIAIIVLIGGAVAAMMIIPSLNTGKKGNNSGSSSQQNSNNNTPTTDPDDNTGDEEEVVKTKKIGDSSKGYIVVPAVWTQVTDESGAFHYKDNEGNNEVVLNSGPIEEVTSESFTDLQLGFSKEEAKEPESVKAVAKTIGDFEMNEIDYFSTTTDRYVKKFVFESQKTKYTYFIWIECKDQKSEYFTSIPKSFTLPAPQTAEE